MSDAAIEEIRERRRQLWRQLYGGSASQFVRESQVWQKAHPSRVVNLRKGLRSRRVA